jgi:hypothetical protein
MPAGGCTGEEGVRGALAGTRASRSGRALDHCWRRQNDLVCEESSDDAGNDRLPAVSAPGACAVASTNGLGIEAHRRPIDIVCFSTPPYARGKAFGVGHGQKPHHLLMAECVCGDSDDADAFITAKSHLAQCVGHLLEVDLGFADPDVDLNRMDQGGFGARK